MTLPYCILRTCYAAPQHRHPQQSILAPPKFSDLYLLSHPQRSEMLEKKLAAKACAQEEHSPEEATSMNGAIMRGSGAKNF